MDSGSALAASEGQGSSFARNRHYYRHTVTSLAYVRLDHGNGGIIRNLSESGMAIQAVGRLHTDQLVHIRFELLKPKIRVDVTGQVIWADMSGQAGLRFVELNSRTQRQLRDWIFSDLLAIATEFGPSRSPIFGTGAEEVDDGQTVAVPKIRLEADDEIPAEHQTAARNEMPLRLPYWPLDIYPRTLARFVDSLVVISAVLLFSVIAIETVGIFPTASTAAAMGVGLLALFGCVYYFFFRMLAGMTFGWYLARLASEDVQWLQEPEEKVTRFR
jgi:hypothetical protein